MIVGTITNLRPHVKLFVRAEGGQGTVEFTVDTGYTGTLTLPPSVCLALQLPLVNEQRMRLADGSLRKMDIYLLAVEWDGVERNVEIVATESDSLLGMTMLEGYDVLMSVKENGSVRIQRSVEGNDVA